MLNLDNIVSNKNTSFSEDNNWPFRMLIIGPSGSDKTNTLLHLIDKLHPIDKIYLYAKDLHKPKYEYLINKREQAGIKNLNDPHAFIEYSDDMNDVLHDINNYKKNRDKKVLIVFDDMIADNKSHIFKHLHSTTTCFDSYNSLCFKIIDKANSKFDLKIKEALHINWRKPNLNAQQNHLALTLSL